MLCLLKWQITNSCLRYIMEIKKKKSVSNSSRHSVHISKFLLSKFSNLIKKRSVFRKNRAGRSKQTGRITMRHRGGGLKKLYKLLIPGKKQYIAVVITTQYDPYRTSFINTCFDLQQLKFFYILSTNHMRPGFLDVSQNKLFELKLGYRTQLKNIPAGSFVHNISVHKNKNLAKSAGCTSKLLENNLNITKINLPSNKIIITNKTNYATIGATSNLNHSLVVLGKAGKNRIRGIRPYVRGIAMNPVDHPHGGRTNGGRVSVSPWGFISKCGYKRRKKLYEQNKKQRNLFS